MGEYLRFEYEIGNEARNTDEYKQLAKIYTEIYAEKENLKHKLRQAWLLIDELSSKIITLEKGQENGK